MEDLIALKQKLWSMLMDNTPIEEIKELESKGEFGNLWVDSVIEEFQENRNS